jgi:exodeoxyribonuclease-3
MRIATFNVNGVNGRLPVLLRWLAETSPDVACLQELKTSDERFPIAAIQGAGYAAVWHGQKAYNGVAILARGARPEEIRRGLPGDDEDTHSRYIEADVKGIRVGCLYLPNGNPAPGPKFDFKLRWFARLHAYAAGLVRLTTPVALCGDYNVVPSDLDAYKPERWVNDAVFFPQSKDAYRRLLEQGWTDAIRHLYPHQGMFTYWDYFRNAYQRDAGIRMDHLLLNRPLAERLVAAGVDRHVRGWAKSSDHAPAWIEIQEIRTVPRGQQSM